MIDIITVRGAGEVHDRPLNMLGNVVELLDKRRFRHVADIDYPASVGAANPQRNPLGPSLKESLTVGKHAIADQVRRTPNRAGLIGYSLGAYAISEFLEDLRDGEPYTDGCDITFVALIADPRRAPSIEAPGYGIAGAHGTWTVRQVWDIANPRDGICCCPPLSPLRTLSDALDAFTFAAGGGWSRDLADRIRRGRWQAARADWWRDPLGAWREYDTAARLIAGYLGIEHTSAYLIDGHTARLASAINQEVH